MLISCLPAPFFLFFTRFAIFKSQGFSLQQTFRWVRRRLLLAEPEVPGCFPEIAALPEKLAEQQTDFPACR
jgi:hypothetical protein